MKYLPIFLDLRGMKVVVVGGGKVAERKVLTLLKAGAEITVVSPVLTPRLSKEKDAKRFRHIGRRISARDLSRAFLVVSATDSPDINRFVSSRSPALVNVADIPSQSNFIAPSLVERGDLVIAISTSGSSPALAKTLRRELEKSFGPEFSAYLALLKRVRARALAEVPHRTERERFLKRIGSRKMVGLLKTGGFAAVRKKVLDDFKETGGKRRAGS